MRQRAGQYQAHRQRREALLNGISQSGFLCLLPKKREHINQYRRRSNHRNGGDDTSKFAGHAADRQSRGIADERDNQNARPGRSLRDGEYVGELGVGQPVLSVHGSHVHVGQNRISATDREQ